MNITQDEFENILYLIHNKDLDYIRGKWSSFDGDRIGFCLSRNPIYSGNALIEYAISKIVDEETNEGKLCKHWLEGLCFDTDMRDKPLRDKNSCEGLLANCKNPKYMVDNEIED